MHLVKCIWSSPCLPESMHIKVNTSPMFYHHLQDCVKQNQVKCSQWWIMICNWHEFLLILELIDWLPRIACYSCSMVIVVSFWCLWSWSWSLHHGRFWWWLPWMVIAVLFLNRRCIDQGRMSDRVSWLVLVPIHLEMMEGRVTHGALNLKLDVVAGPWQFTGGLATMYNVQWNKQATINPHQNKH